MIRVVLPAPLRAIAKIDQEELRYALTTPATQRAVLDAVEADYPALRGTIRDQVTFKRRGFLRFFACSRDLSHESPDAPLPDEVQDGREPFLVVGATAGG
jgi:molybdopterin synthase sulfur carrier subunit